MLGAGSAALLGLLARFGSLHAGKREEEREERDRWDPRESKIT
jgi:hypothetical protein